MAGIFNSGIFNNTVFNTGDVTVVVTPTVVEPSQGGAKKRIRIRGPYNDPRIFDEYIKRCIAEREAPRASVQTAILKESLVEVVAERKGVSVLDWATLIREQEILERLSAVENAKRDIAAIEARMRQITKQLQQLEDDEVSMVLAIFDELDGD